MKDLKSNKSTISNVRGTLYLRLRTLSLKMRLWGLRIQLKKILKIEGTNFSLFNIILKNVFLQKYKDKNIPYIVNLSLVISTHYMHEKIPEKYLDFSQKEKEIIDNEKSLVLENEDLKGIISDHHLFVSFYHLSSSSFFPLSDKSKKISDECFEKAAKYNKYAKPLTNELFREKIIEIENRLKKEKKKYNTEIRSLRNARIRSMLPKINFSPQLITFIFTVISIMFLLTGYIYNKYLLGYYNIEVSHFFSSGDYLSTCIDKFYISGMSVLWSLFGLIVGGYVGVSNAAQKKIFDHKKNKVVIIFERLEDLAILLLILMVTVTVIANFYMNNIYRYNIIKTLILILITAIYAWMLLNKIIKEKAIYLSVLLLGASIFLVNISCELMNDIEKINRLNISDLKKYEFVFDREIEKDHNSLILLSANSGYFFFYDREKKKSIVIPKGSVKYIELIQK